MNRFLVVNIVLLFGASVVWAQREGSPGPGRGEWFGGMLERLANQLELDESQRAAFQEAAAAQRERFQSMGQRWQELRQAMRDGDEERAAALRAELEGARSEDGPLGPLFKEIEPLLREDQLERLHAMQEQMQQRRRSGEAFRRVMTELPEELGLDEGQRQQWDELLAARRDQRRGQWEEMRPAMEEMRAAREAGDEARMEELRRQLEETRPNPEQMLATFLEEVEGILRDDQKGILEAYRQELGVGGQQEEVSEPGDLRNILRAVKRVRVSSEQRAAIKEIEQKAGKAWREIDRRDAEARGELADRVKQQLLDVLDPEQTRQFEGNLERLDHPERRGRTRETGRGP